MKRIAERIAGVGTFLGEVRTEMYKSSWPDRGELFESTVVVIVSVVLLAVFIGLSDTVLAWLVQTMV
jgi:preprotein translocase subunit SecE